MVCVRNTPLDACCFWLVKGQLGGNRGQRQEQRWWKGPPTNRCGPPERVTQLLPLSSALSVTLRCRPLCWMSSVWKYEQRCCGNFITLKKNYKHFGPAQWMGTTEWLPPPFMDGYCGCADSYIRVQWTEIQRWHFSQCHWIVRKGAQKPDLATALVCLAVDLLVTDDTRALCLWWEKKTQLYSWWQHSTFKLI